MPAFRKSGSFVRFRVEGSIPKPDSDELLEALLEERFRTIENAASEETSVGWVSPGDPSGNDFIREEIAHGDVARLRVRVDRKKLPASWLGIYLAAEVRARDGQKISARERKEIKGDIAEKLLPRILPSVAFVDLIYDSKSKQVVMFGTSTAMAGEIAKLFLRSFDARLVEADPTTCALGAKLTPEQEDALGRAKPIELKQAQKNGVAKPAVTSRASSSNDDRTANTTTGRDDDAHDATSGNQEIEAGAEA